VTLTDPDPPDLTAAFEALADQFRLLSTRIGAVEGTVAGAVGAGSGLVGTPGPAGPPGPPGADGSAGAGTASIVSSHSTLPSSPATGQLAYASDTGHLWVYDGGAWHDTDSGVGGTPGGASSYAALVLRDGPVGYWPLNDPLGSSSFADLSGNNLIGRIDSGIPVGGSMLTPPSPGAVLGAPSVLPALPDETSMAFDGRMDVGAHVPGLTALITDHIGQSLEWWVYIDPYLWVPARPSDVPPYPGATREGSGIAYCYVAFAGSGNATNNMDGDFSGHFETGDRSGSFPDQFIGLPMSGSHHFCVTRRTGGKYRLYVDGEPMQTNYTSLTHVDPDGRNAVTFATSSILYLGKQRATTPATFVGRLAHVAIYSKELSPDQVLAHYNAGHP